MPVNYLRIFIGLVQGFAAGITSVKQPSQPVSRRTPDAARHSHRQSRADKRGRRGRAVPTIRLALPLACLVFAISAGADPALQSPDSIRAAARNYAAAHLGLAGHETAIEVSTLDARLRLAACDNALQGFLPPAARQMGSTTVGVRCTGTRPWTLYVPVNVRVFGDVVIAARTLPRAAVLQAGDVRTARRNLAALSPGYITDVKSVLGMVLQRPLSPGTLLDQSALKPRRLVHRGETVTIVAETGGLTVRVNGTALMDGSYGQLIRVRNQGSRREIQGVVTAAGQVQVRL